MDAVERLFVEIGGEFLPLTEIDEVDFRSCVPANMIGVPTVWCMTKDDGRRLWPKPLKACKIWRLEPAAHADGPK